MGGNCDVTQSEGGLRGGQIYKHMLLREANLFSLASDLHADSGMDAKELKEYHIVGSDGSNEGGIDM